MTEHADVTISIMPAEAAGARLGELAWLLHACVRAGASVNFVLPFAITESEAFWRDKVMPGLIASTRTLFVAEEAGRIVGTVQLDHDTPPNQPHRAEVTKLLVHPDWRRRGIARALMAALESQAAIIGRDLITLDTRTGDSAEPLYRAIGYHTAGVIPDYCLDPFENRLDPTTIMYKRL